MIETILNATGIGIALFVMWDNNKRFAATLERHTRAINDICIKLEKHF